MDEVVLGEVTCPSGELVLTDGGYLGLWSGNRAPESVQPDENPDSVDLEIVGPDAMTAARSFGRQSGQTLYDIPAQGLDSFTSTFDQHCREHGFAASLRRLPNQVPHRERVRRAVAAADRDFVFCGVPVVPIGDVPIGPLPVVAIVDDEWGWRAIRILLRDQPVAQMLPLGAIAVDYARFVIADADALSEWVHEDAVDGLADVVFWGRDEAAVAAEVGAARTGVAGDDVYGWLNLPLGEAVEKGQALDRLRNGSADLRFAFDFRPHSDHWRVMAGVRASKHDAATIEVGGAQVMFAMTSVGDGYFPVHVERSADGVPVAIQITIATEDEDDASKVV